MLGSLAQNLCNVLWLLHRYSKTAKTTTHSSKVSVSPAERRTTTLKQDAMVVIDPTRSLIVEDEHLDVQAIIDGSGQLTDRVGDTMVATKSPDRGIRSRARRA